jgi:phosphatidylserine/phosphatidylglycerophosphate/cardiolipin synthase-like enzyme/uncharacterized membrane protein YdjX (TVP38/TMEM64 family)
MYFADVIFEPAKNCWRLTHTDRLGFLVDGAAYFSAFREAAIRAERSIAMLGWDFDTLVPLLPDDAPEDGYPRTLLAFLNALCRRKPELSIYVLAWDFSLIYTFEREPVPAVNFGWRSHRRVHFALDGEHPVGASHHQKVVVVDDEVAFVGGMDLTFARWDTPEHRAGDPRRKIHDGSVARPMHDVQLAASGETARALGDLFRSRWHAATGQILPPSGPARDRAADPWPPSLTADIEGVDVAIARTVPPSRHDDPGVREIETLTLAAIAEARRTIFIENQYLTAGAVGHALARRLRESEGPEVILVLPRDQGGWLEQSSMGVLRDRLLAKLRENDPYGRLRACHPTVPGLPSDQCLGVHSKLLIVDDTFLKVGSANLSNRSMGLDTECDLAISAPHEDGDVSRAIARLRSRLLGEHLGVAPAALEAAFDETHSWIAAIDALQGGPRTLVPLTPGEEPPLHLAVMDGLVVDPERPIAPEKLLQEFVPPDSRKHARRSVLSYAALLGALLAIGAIWRFTPLHEFMVVERIVAVGRGLRDDPYAWVYILGAFLAGGLLFFPVTLLIAATALLFDPWHGFAFALTGCLTSASATYGMGRLLGRPMVERMLHKPRMRRFRKELQRRSFAAIFGARLIPVGNFSVVNLLAGALEVPFRSYFMGNVFGVLPGILGLTIFADRLHDTLAHPGVANVTTLVAVLGAIVGAIVLLRRALRRAGSADVASLREAKES